MSKQQILKQIDELKQKIEELEKKVTSPELEGVKKSVRWQPILGQRYFYIDDGGVIRCVEWQYDDEDVFRFNTGNCFKTEQEAKDFKENILTKQALKDLALELNEGKQIDWHDSRQHKYSLQIDYDYGKYYLSSDPMSSIKELGQVFCLDKDFLTIAKKRIGEEKLIKLIKAGV